MITDIINTLESPPRITEMGKIKIGGLGDVRKNSSGKEWRMPRKDDHFTITTLNRTAARDLVKDDKLMAQLIAQYGDPDNKLRQIPIRLLSDDIEDVLQVSWMWYGRKSCGARSDGKTVKWFVCPNPGPEFGVPYPPGKPFEEPWTEAIRDMKDPQGNQMFKLHSTFNCVIAAQESRFGGVYKFRTTSEISFKQLYASLIEIQSLTGGVLVGMPLFMVVRPMQVSPNGQATTVHVVHLELRGAGLAELQAQAVKQMAFMLDNRQRLIQTQQQYRKLLAAPETEDAADIAAEFHPEAAELPAAEPAPEHYGILDDDSPTPPDQEGIGKDAPGGQTKAEVQGVAPGSKAHSSQVGQVVAETVTPDQSTPSAPQSAPVQTASTPAAPVAESDPRSAEEMAREYADNLGQGELIGVFVASNPKALAAAMKAAKVSGPHAALTEADQRRVAYYVKLGQLKK